MMDDLVKHNTKTALVKNLASADLNAASGSITGIYGPSIISSELWRLSLGADDGMFKALFSEERKRKLTN